MEFKKLFNNVSELIKVQVLMMHVIVASGYTERLFHFLIPTDFDLHIDDRSDQVLTFEAKTTYLL